jgi:rhamnosyltransferase
LILTCDGGDRLGVVLDSLRRQVAPFQFEVLAVDSETADGTPDRLAAAGVPFIRVSRGDFNHGTTRNDGIGACRGTFVVLLVQDAVPDSHDLLARLVTPLLEDETLAATYARQVPPPGSCAVARAYLSLYPGGSESPRVHAVAGAEAFRRLSPAQQLALCTFDNVCSCIRRSAWERNPFPRARIAEDVEWARTVLLSGSRIAFVPGAVVQHLHERSALYELKRTYLVHQQLCRLFGLRTVPSLLHLARSTAVSLLSHARWVAADATPWRRKIAELPRAAALAFVLPLGQYLGGRSADTNRDLLGVRGV